MMSKTIIPKGYEPQFSLSVMETESAILKIKAIFEEYLAAASHLKRVSAPLFVDPDDRAQRRFERRGAAGEL